jgi:hypothetical protein
MILSDPASFGVCCQRSWVSQENPVWRKFSGDLRLDGSQEPFFFGFQEMSELYCSMYNDKVLEENCRVQC